jgi:hypothetical protein
LAVDFEDRSPRAGHGFYVLERWEHLWSFPSEESATWQ